jgi:hypothetical protein
MKDALYLETDEEITSAIDKMSKFPGDSVSIVVPKRSSLLQSIVNLRLLKKAADDAGKELVLVTTDKTTTHLAAKTGLAVASSLKAAPVMPKVETPEPDDGAEIVESADEGTEETVEAPVVAKKATKPSFAKPMLVRTPVGPAEESVEPDKKGPKVPNFNSLQKRLMIGGGLLAVFLLGWMLNFFLKTATVTLYARGTRVAAQFDFTVDPGIKESDFDKAVLMGQKLEVNKDLAGSVPATGKKDVGTKASGTMTVYNGYDSNARTFPAGTRFRAPDGKIFVSKSDVTVPGAGIVAGSLVPGQKQVSVEAEAAGDQYNLAPARYSIPSLPADQQDDIYGQGNQMTGGTTKQVTVVSQEDIDKAKIDLLKNEQDKAKKELEDRASSGYAVLPESFFEEAKNVTSNPAVGAEASTVNVTVSVTYTQLAVNKAEYEKMVETQELAKIGSQNQIYDNGIENAKLTSLKREPSGRQSFNFSAEAYAGPKIDTKAIAKNVAGKIYSEAAEEASRVPGVEKAEVDISPGWNTRLPRLSGKIKVEIKVAE